MLTSNPLCDPISFSLLLSKQLFYASLSLFQPKHLLLHAYCQSVTPYITQKILIEGIRRELPQIDITMFAHHAGAIPTYLSLLLLPWIMYPCSYLKSIASLVFYVPTSLKLLRDFALSILSSLLIINFFFLLDHLPPCKHTINSPILNNKQTFSFLLLPQYLQFVIS